MNVRAALAVFALAGLPAAAGAQETITYTLSWIEVVASTSTPVPNPNGVVEPGEGARVRITTLITPGVGSIVTYQAPPAPGHGTIAGMGSIFFDLLPTNAMGGLWSHVRVANSPFPPPPANTTPEGGLSAGQAGQFVLPGLIANPSNPYENLWQATWTPSNYSARPVTFTSVAAAAAGMNHSSILIQYGTEPGAGYPLYVGRFIDGIFGNTGPIPVVPAPWSLATLALASALTRPRRAT